MDEVEALARAYCREMGLDPDRIVQHGSPNSDWHEIGPLWRRFDRAAREHLAWSRAMEAVKRDE